MNMVVKETMPTLGIVIPVYNEQEIIEITISKITSILQELISKQKISPKSFVLFVNDGSQDASWSLLEKHCQTNEKCKAIKLSRNYGHQKALMAGLLTARNYADCVISMDADLQDEVSLIEEFINNFTQGYDIVYGVRKTRTLDSRLKRGFASLYYKMMIKLGVKIKYNHADYRLMSQRALNHLSEFQESNLFLRGMIPLLGFASKDIYYDRQKRVGGVTKYPVRKMLSLAIDGLTSFSTAPLRLITFLGFAIFAFSLVMSCYFLLEKFVFHNVVPGWTSIIFSIYMLSGVQLLCLGIIGEYIGKIFNEAKRRPRFIIEQSIL